MDKIKISKDADIRKQETTLICSGWAMIFFGIWSIIRMVLLRFIDPDHFIDFLGDIDYQLDSSLLNLILLLFIILLFFDLLLRMYIGFSAIKEGHGKLKKRYTYVIIAIICFVISIGSDVASVITLIDDDVTFEYVLSTIIDISIQFATLEVIIASIRLRKLSKDN